MNRFVIILSSTLLILLFIYGLSGLINTNIRNKPTSTEKPTYKLSPLPPAIEQKVPASTTKETIEDIPKPIVARPQFLDYLEITAGCALAANNTCNKAYAKPDTSSSERAKLRIGTVLEIGDSTTTEDGAMWYEIVFNEPLRYEERVKLPWFVLASSGVTHRLKAPADLNENTPSTSKALLVDRSEQTMTAYAGGEIIRTYTISTGLELSPTPRGVFTVYRMTPSRYMQGPIIGINNKYYDLPGVPWNLYFTKEGAVVHGAYWHNAFGSQYSSGCVNVKPSEAKELYDWAELGMTITVRD